MELDGYSPETWNIHEHAINFILRVACIGSREVDAVFPF